MTVAAAAVGKEILLVVTVSSALLATYNLDPAGIKAACTGAIPTRRVPNMLSPETFMSLEEPLSRWLSPTPSVLIETTKCAGAGLGCNPRIGWATGRYVSPQLAQMSPSNMVNTALSVRDGAECA